MTTDTPTIHAEPARSTWRALVESPPLAPDERSRRLRAQLGLPTDRPVIMSGHQASFWHAGILAKVFATDATAQATCAAAAWVVVDQDEAEFAVIRAPVRDGRNRLAVQELKLCDPPSPGIASASLPPFEAKSLKPAGGPFALPAVSWGAASITESLLSRRSEPTAARQVAEASFDLLASHVQRPALLYASTLASAEAFRALVEQMAREPARAIGAYNEAVARFPEAGLTPLAADAAKNRWELPLWRLENGKPRQRVWSDALNAETLNGLAPRALLLTGFLRLTACELFVHGKGGAIYDRATEAWLSTWLGATLAPTVMISADLLLPFEEAAVSPSDVNAAVWRAAHARHDPALTGRADLVPKKKAMVEAIRAARERGENPLPIYLEMHRMLATYRDQERGRLGDLKDAANRLVAIRATASIAADRTWPFPFHRAESIAALHNQIAAE